MSEGEIQRQLNPAALAPAEVARLLTAAGGWSVSPEMVEEDLAQGAPRNPDGTVNLVHYVAWLVSMER